MEIKLPPTLTARYDGGGDWSDDEQDTLPGVIVLEFGEFPVAEIKVSSTDHYNLTQYYRHDLDREDREQTEVARIVARWLAERLR